MQKEDIKYSYGKKIILDNVEYIKAREEGELTKLFPLDFKRFLEILKSFSDFIDENKKYKYETVYWDGVKKEITLGEGYDLNPFNRTSNKLSNYPLSKEIIIFKNKVGLGVEELVQLDYYLEIACRMAYSYSPRYLPWANDVLNRFLPLNQLVDFANSFKEFKYRSKIVTYIKLLIGEERDLDRYYLYKNISEILYQMLSKEECIKPYLVKGDSYFYGSSHDALICSSEFRYFLRKLEDLSYDERFFKGYFKIAYNYYRKCGYADFAILNQSSFIKWENKMVD